jgi:hypothetical protein
VYLGIGNTLWWQGIFQVDDFEDAGLRKTIHPLPNLDVDPAIRSENVVKVVMDNDFVGLGMMSR